MRINFDIAQSTCTYLGVFLGIVMGIASLRGHHYIGLWLGVAALVAATVGGGFWLHDYWKKEELAAADTTAAADAELLGFTRTMLQRPMRVGEEPVIGIEVKNHSDKPLRFIGFAGTSRYRTPGDDDFTAELENCKKLALHEGPDTPVPAKEPYHFSVFVTPALTTDRSEEIVTGKKRLYVISTALYRDTAGRLRSTSSCAFFNPSLNAFLRHNDEFNRVGVEENLDRLTVPKRPVLAFADAQMSSFEAGKPIACQINFNNLGAGRAIRLAGALKQIVGARGAETDAAIAARFAGWPTTGIENQVKPLGDFGLTSTSETILTDHEAGSIAKGEQLLFTFGRLVYFDDAGGAHWTNFCLACDGTTFQRYAKFNEADNNEYGEGGEPPEDAATHAPPPPAESRESGEEKPTEGGNR